jgi:lipoyl(octanoyl) transferase
LSYRVVYKDIGLMEYKQAWDYQAGIFNRLTDYKKARNLSVGNPDETLPGTLILVEHPHVITLGRSGSSDNLLLDSTQLSKKNVSFYRIDRGGDVTYHGPGQIVGYPIFDLELIGISLKEYIHRLEEAIIMTVAEYGITASRLAGGTGVWIDPGKPGKARKICAIGVKASRYITMHGFAFNVNTDLSFFNFINPCGFTDKGVTSLENELGSRQDFDAVRNRVKESLQDVFGLNGLMRKWMDKSWIVKEKGEPSVVRQLALSLGVSDSLANLMVQRKITCAAEAKAFFNPSLDYLHDPFLMKDMNIAVDRISTAIKRNQKILVYGDYDVDGTTAVALVYSFLRELKSNVGYYIPDRYKEGYGVSFEGLDFAYKNNCKVVITLDCGIKSVEKVKYALTKGSM